MPGYIPLTPPPLPSIGSHESLAWEPLATRMPNSISFAVTPMTVPDGLDAFHRPVRGSGQSMGWRNRHRYENATRRPHAIILDNDPAVLNVLGQLLDEEDYDVTLSTRFLDRDDVMPLNPDVIIADAAFNSGPDGKCLYAEPLEHPDGTAIPVVYSTTIPDVAARLSAMTLPILLKPFDLDMLVTLLRQGHT